MSEAGNSPSLERQLRSRLLLMIGAIWTIASMIVLVAVRNQAVALLDDALLETGEQLMAMPDVALGEGEAPPRVVEIGTDLSDIVYQVYDHTGKLRLRSHAAPSDPLSPEQFEDGHFETPRWYGQSFSRPDGARRVVVAQEHASRQEALWDINLWLLLPLLTFLPLTGVLVQRVLRRTFSGLEPLRRDLAERAPHQLQPADLSAAPQELRPMLETVNGLMLRVQTLIKAERAFAAHTAHELRTPLAAARAQAQRLAVEAQSSASEQLVERAQALVRQLDRLTRLSTRLLQLARIESGVALQRASVDLLQLAGMVSDEFGEARIQRRLAVIAETEQIEPIDGDVDALGIALRNLIDNALKHGGARVRVCVGPGRLAVQDSGPGIPPDQRDRVSRPFERGSTAAEGSGLGLTMVQTIARQSGGEMVLRDLPPDPEGWRFEISLEFPLAPAPADAAPHAATDATAA